eukprot:2442162-Rhodomonas_salina.1
MAFPSPSADNFPLTPNQDVHVQLNQLLDSNPLDDHTARSPSPIMTPNSRELSQPMDTSQVNGRMEERDEEESSSAAALTGSQSPAGKKNRKRLPVDQLSAAALRMRVMRER